MKCSTAFNLDQQPQVNRSRILHSRIGSWDVVKRRGRSVRRQAIESIGWGRWARAVGMLLAIGLGGRSVSADIVIYSIPKLQPPLVVMLQGQTKVLAGGTISYRHPKFSSSRLILSIENARTYDTLSPRELFRRQHRKATQSGSGDRVMESALWALNHGLMDLFYEAVDDALEIDPQHALAKSILALRKKMDVPVPATEDQKNHVKSTVPLRNMRFETSEHFLLYCDTPTEPSPHHKDPRAQERLELLELVYRSFVYRFAMLDAAIELPTEPLQVVLFNNEPDFRDFSVRLSPTLASAAGFWDSSTNISFFYDHGTSAEYQMIAKMARDLQQMKDRFIRDKKAYAPGEVAKFARMADTMGLLVEISQEDSDIEVVSHEVTHQMAGNTGLLPRRVRVPTWVHEGLATFFEAPKDATWSGIGAVNETRLEWFRGLASDRVHSNIDFIANDNIFTQAGSHGATLHAYGQAWGLTHFLMNEHPDQLIQFYKRLGDLPPDYIIGRPTLLELFSESFGSDHKKLDMQWKSYMRGLKTDVEKFIQTARR